MGTEVDGWQSLVKPFPALHSTTGHTACQRYGLLCALGSWCVPSPVLAAVGDITTSSAQFDHAFNSQQLPFGSTERLLSEDAESTAWTIQALFQPRDFPGAVGSSTLFFQLRAALLISSDNIICQAFLHLFLQATAVPEGATV